MNHRKIKVLFIAGFGRSGSTLLGKILGQFDGFFFGSELRSIWGRGLIENRLCGCGTAFKECQVWKSIMDAAFGGMDLVDAQEMISLRESGARTRHLPFMMTPWGKRLLTARLAKFLDALEKLLGGIRDATGSQLIIDASKYPTYGYLLGLIPSVDLYVVHLVRDPRAVAFSWSRKRIQPGREDLHMRRYGPAASSVRWVVRNLAAEAFWRRTPERYLMLRYEDFVSQPRVAIMRILDLVGESPQNTLFETDNSVNVGPNHGVWGNPGRFVQGAVNIHSNEKWKKEIKPWNRHVASLLTWPLLARYGYLFRGS